jgi:PleD family two-component response regulator
VIDLLTHRLRIGLGLVLSAAALISTTVWLLPAGHDDQILACTVALSMALAAVLWRAVGNYAFGEADRMLYEAKAAGRNQWALAAANPPEPYVVAL